MARTLISSGLICFNYSQLHHTFEHFIQCQLPNISHLTFMEKLVKCEMKMKAL